MYLIHPLAKHPTAIMVWVSPAHLPSGPQDFHVHQDYVQGDFFNWCPPKNHKFFWSVNSDTKNFFDGIYYVI